MGQFLNHHGVRHHRRLHGRRSGLRGHGQIRRGSIRGRRRRRDGKLLLLLENVHSSGKIHVYQSQHSQGHYQKHQNNDTEIAHRSGGRS